MPLLLFRHAWAGHRRPGDDQDHLRPLDERGRRQAAAVPAQFEGFDVDRIVTSPYVRCRSSVEPLAASRGLPIEERVEVAEGTTADEVRSLVAEVAGDATVLCTHGDVLEMLLGEQPEKGSTWLVEPDGDGGVTRRQYLPPPA